jgi:hypothetical protein
VENESLVTDLIEKVAALQGEEAAAKAEADPWGWWSSQGHGGAAV